MNVRILIHSIVRQTTLSARIEQYNATHGRPDDYDQVVICAGQHVWPRHKDEGQS